MIVVQIKSQLFGFAVVVEQGEGVPREAEHVLAQALVQREIVNCDLVLVERLRLAHKLLCLLALEAEPIREHNYRMCRQQLIQLVLGFGSQTVPGNQRQELTLRHQLLAHVQAPHQLALAVELWVGRPTAVVPQPVTHVLVLQDVVVSKLDVVVAQQLDEGLGEPALGGGRSALYENYHRRFAEDAPDLRVPYLLLLLEPIAKRLRLLRQRVEDDAYVIGLKFLQHLFVRLSEYHCRSVLNRVLLECLGTLLSRNSEILDVVEQSEERDSCGEVVPEREGGLVPLRVEHEDEQLPEVVEEGAGKHLVRLELLQSHVSIDDINYKQIISYRSTS